MHLYYEVETRKQDELKTLQLHWIIAVSAISLLELISISKALTWHAQIVVQEEDDPVPSVAPEIYLGVNASPVCILWL